MHVHMHIHTDKNSTYKTKTDKKSTIFLMRKQMVNDVTILKVYPTKYDPMIKLSFHKYHEEKKIVFSMQKENN